MTQELLAQVVKKNSLYVKWKITPVTHFLMTLLNRDLRYTETDTNIQKQ